MPTKEKNPDSDWWDELTPDEQSELDAALAESYDEENWVPDEEAQTIIQQWLNRDPPTDPTISR